MKIGILPVIPARVNLPGQSGGGGPTGPTVEQIDNEFAFDFERASRSQFIIQPTDIMTGATSFSITFWANLDRTTVDQTVFADWGVIPRFLMYYQKNNSWRILFNDSLGRGGSNTSGLTHTAGTWQFVAFTYDGATRQIKSYVDNAVPGNATNAGTPGFEWPNYPYHLIGEDDSSTTRACDGMLDEIALFDYALDEDTIKVIYAAMSGGKTANLDTLSTGAPKVWYRMGD